MKVEKLVLQWIWRTAKSLILGSIEAAVLIAVFYYGSLFLLDRLLASLPEVPVGIEQVIGEARGFIVIGIAIFLLNITSRILSGTIYSPIFRSASILLALIISIVVLNGGFLSVEGIPVGGSTVNISLDLSPILFIITVFLTLPMIVMYFIDYFIESATT